MEWQRENSTIKIFSTPLFGAQAGVGAGDRDLAGVPRSGGGSIPSSVLVGALFLQLKINRSEWDKKG